MRITTLLLSTALLLAAARPARAVLLDVGDAAGTVGDTVLVAVTTPDLTGLGVYSYELTITWSSTYATALDASVTGTLTSPWGGVTTHPTAGRVDIAAAGVSPLSGSGTLVYLRFVLGPSSGNANLTFASSLFNEGSPATTRTNGSLSITALPVVTISPNTGEILVGETLAFSASGGSPPYTYQSSDNGVATFGGTSMLTGVSPGSVTAMATDNNGISDITNGIINVRALRLTVGTAGGAPLDTVLVPVSITNPAPYGIRSAEFEVAYNGTYITAIGASGTGTIADAAGWGAPVAGVSSGKVHVAMAGTADLAGPGVLTYLRFVVNPGNSGGGVTLTPSNAVFNETYAAINVAGSLVITVPSTITVNPNTSTIVAGDMLQFSISGATTMPIAWGVTNPSVASIDGAGKLTATAAGTTRVHATDAIGRTDTTDTITICDLYLIAPTDTIFLTYPTAVPIKTDRGTTGLGIYGYELTLSFDPTKLFVAGVDASGTASFPWGTPVYNTSIPGKVVIVHAGATPLSGTLPLIKVLFQAYIPLYGTSTSLTITKILFNEGHPCALVKNGTLSFPTGIHDGRPPALELDQNVPNPFNPRTEIIYRIGTTGGASLRIYSADGALVRTLADGAHRAGLIYRADWDGTDDRGRRVASGVYFYRLENAGEHTTRKMLLLK